MSTERLDLSDEFRGIGRAIRESVHRDFLEVVPVMAARAEDLEGALIQHKPVIVHFSGHGRADLGMVLRVTVGMMLGPWGPMRWGACSGF